MVSAPVFIAIARRIVSLLALAVYGFILVFGTLLLLSFAFNPLISRPWTCVAAILARWVPVAIYIWLWRYSSQISPAFRSMALAMGIFSISLSYFFGCLAAEDTLSEVLFKFRQGYWECTLDLWPCIVMLLCVTSRAAERTKQQESQAA